jgi:hypothetical protein
MYNGNIKLCNILLENISDIECVGTMPEEVLNDLFFFGTLAILLLYANAIPD